MICLVHTASTRQTRESHRSSCYPTSKFLLRTIPPTVTTHININSSRAHLLAPREEVEYGKWMGFQEPPLDTQITKVYVTPRGTWDAYTCKHDHVHNPVTPFTCSVAYPAHLDREDICSVSCVHGEQLLVVQWVPHNRVLVIGTRGQQAANRGRGSDLSSNLWAILPRPTFLDNKELGNTELK